MRQKWHSGDKPLKKGDIVLILDSNIERNQWRKGVVIRTYPGSDGQVRVVDVRTSFGILSRPTRKLVKLAEE